MGHEHWTQSYSAKTGVWDHISPAERSDLPLSPSLLSVTNMKETLTQTHITDIYSNGRTPLDSNAHTDVR